MSKIIKLNLLNMKIIRKKYLNMKELEIKGLKHLQMKEIDAIQYLDQMHKIMLILYKKG